MKKLLLMLGFIFISYIANGAKPIEIENDRLTYSIDIIEGTASVVKANQEIETASILDSIVYDAKKYPVESIGKSAFWYCAKMKKIYIPSSVKSFKSVCFSLCYLLKEVYIEDLASWCCASFDWLDANPLENANLYINDILVQELLIPEGVEFVSSYSFRRCESIVSIATPTSLKSIGSQSFAKCPNLKLVDLNINIIAIEDDAFMGCEDLDTFYVRSNNPPKVGKGDNGSPFGFKDLYPQYMTLHIPEGTKHLYENANGWKDFGSIIDDLPSDSGVEEVIIDETKPIEIFNLNGVMVFSGIGDYTLPRGIYIIRQGLKSKKIVIK